MRGHATWLAVAAVVTALAPAAARAAKPAPVPASPPSLLKGTTGTMSVDVWGQPDSAEESAGRPLASTLALFRSSARASAMPPASGFGLSLPTVAADMRGHPGKLVAAKARRVDTPVGRVYAVPTGRGWICMQGSTFATCHRGLLRSGVTWDFYSTKTGIEVVGIAADDVTRVVLAGGGRKWTAWLRDNVFVVSRPIVLTSVQNLPPLGTLVVSYRGGRRTARVPLR